MPDVGGPQDTGAKYETDDSLTTSGDVKLPTANIIEWDGQLELSSDTALLYVKDESAAYNVGISTKNIQLHDSSGNDIIHLDAESDTISMSNAVKLNWSSDGDYDTTADTGIGRQGAGIVEITDGSSGGGDLMVGTTTTRLCAGSGSPEGAKTARPGSIYMNSAGGTETSIWVKNSGTGNTGWIALAEVAGG
jgi:hypothetical protein